MEPTHHHAALDNPFSRRVAIRLGHLYPSIDVATRTSFSMSLAFGKLNERLDFTLRFFRCPETGSFEAKVSIPIAQNVFIAAD